jgi:WD40 repeat protein
VEIGSYKLDLVKRFEPAVGATFVRKRDALLVASERASDFELQLLDLPKFKTLGRASVRNLASVFPLGEKRVLLMKAIDLEAEGEDEYKQTFEVLDLKGFGVNASFVEDRPGHVATHPDGSQVAVGHESGALNVWDARTGGLLASHEAKGVGGVDYSRDGELLAAKEYSGSLKIFDAAKPGEKPLRSVTVGRGEAQVAFHPRSHLVAAAGTSAIKIVDADAAEVTASIKTTKKESQSAIGHMTISPDGKLLVTSSLSHGAIGLWDLEKAEFIGHAMELKRPVSAVEFDAEGKYLLVATFQAAEVYAVSAA